MAPDPALDADVRRFDEDRWLASRFASADVRKRLVALYALNHEIARTAETVRQAAIGDIRLRWWRDAIDEAIGGKPVRAHPVVQAFAAAHAERAFSQATLNTLIDARAADLEPAPFATWEKLDAYLDATAGGVMRLACQACGAGADADAIAPAGRAWGYAGLMRAGANWQARGRSFLPPGGDPHAMLERARAAHAEARAKALDAAAFPAMGYVALVPGYLRALERGDTARPLLVRQLRLIAVSATGRV